jgi:hypothetical protein
LKLPKQIGEFEKIFENRSFGIYNLFDEYIALIRMRESILNNCMLDINKE